MDYYKISITITPFEDWLRDVLASQLGEIGFESFVETESGLDAFVQSKLFDESQLEFVLSSFSEDFKFSVENELIKSRNWNEEWEKNYFRPLVISNECVIRAPFHTDFPILKYEIVIEPNMAFGTGNHETTTMMIETILENDFVGKTVLDMGCGTGILGILASMKGAATITAIDIDEWSFNGTTENTVLNNISNLQVKLGDASLLGTEKFDIILANIHKNVLISDLPVYASILEPGGILVMSGFYTTDLDEISANAIKNGLKSNRFKSKNNWVAAVFKK